MDVWWGAFLPLGKYGARARATGYARALCMGRWRGARRMRAGADGARERYVRAEPIAERAGRIRLWRIARVPGELLDGPASVKRQPLDGEDGQSDEEGEDPEVLGGGGEFFEKGQEGGGLWGVGGVVEGDGVLVGQAGRGGGEAGFARVVEIGGELDRRMDVWDLVEPGGVAVERGGVVVNGDAGGDVEVGVDDVDVCASGWDGDVP